MRSRRVRAPRSRRRSSAAAILFLLATASPAAHATPPDQELAWHAVEIPAGDQPFEVLDADLDGDGDLDIAVTDSKDSTLSVYLGNGDGSFAPRTTIPTGEFPRGLVVADFNRDGKLDLAVAATRGEGVYLHDGLGGGRFDAGRQFKTGIRPFHAVVADWNGDGIADIGVANEHKNVSIMLGDGAGGFSITQQTVGKYPSNVAAADWNEDGHLDFASTNWGDNEVSLHLGSGDGKRFAARRDLTYEPAVTSQSAPGHGLFGIIAADLDRDGHADMVWNDIMRAAFWILYGDGSGSFPRTRLVPASGGIRSVRAFDLDADGWLDLISANTAGGSVAVALADGKGGYLPTQLIPVGVKPRVVTVGDFNGDGRPDIAVTNMDSDSLTIISQVGTQPRASAEFDPGPQQTKRILELTGLRAPTAALRDPDGNLLIADQQHNRVVRAARADGALTTVAGTGQSDFQGDEGAAIEASLRLPSSLALDRDGALLIADFDNNRIRRVDAAGVITTIAGTGEAGYGGDGGPATAARIYRPFSLARAADGTLYFADLQNNRVRKIDPAGVISTVAGTGVIGTAGDGGPAAAAQIGPFNTIAVGRDGTLYIADQLNGLVRRVDAAGTISTAARGIGQPAAIAVDDAGAVFVLTPDRIARLDGNGGSETAVDLKPIRQTGGIKGMPASLALDNDGSFLIADPSGNQVVRIARDGSATRVAGAP